jgi:hypothetical protein
MPLLVDVHARHPGIGRVQSAGGPADPESTLSRGSFLQAIERESARCGTKDTKITKDFKEMCEFLAPSPR